MANLRSMISQIFYAPTPVVQKTSVNPFASNPFVTTSVQHSMAFDSKYGKNQPVQGGYFAGYYNNKPNIVGQRLYVLA